MEEKRYELLNDNGIYDNNLKEYVSSPCVSRKCCMETLTYLLNQQNEKIKQLKDQLEIFKVSNDVLQQDNLDLSYDKVDIAYGYAKEMAENWERDYQEEIQQLKKSQKELAINELLKLSKHFVYSGDEMVSDYDLDCYPSELKEEIERRIRSLKRKK